MNIITPQENIKFALQNISRVPASGVTLPALQNVFLKAENGLVTITATNLEITVMVRMRAKVETDGEALVQTKLFTEIINQAPKENLNLELKTEGLHIGTEHFSVTLRTSSDEFPPIPLSFVQEPLHISAEELSAAISDVAFSASTSDTQAELSGILFVSKSGKLHLAATDRYRLAERGTNIAFTEKSVIVPLKASQEIMRIAASSQEDVKLHFSDHQLVCEFENGVVIAANLVNGEFPEYEAIIPKESNITAMADRAEILQAVKSVGVLSSGENLIVLEFDPENQKIIATSGQQELGQGLVEVSCTGQGSKAESVFNYRYIVDALSALTCKSVVFSLTKGDDPVVIKQEGHENFVYVVMPIRK